MYKYVLGMLLALPVGISCMEEDPQEPKQEKTEDADMQDLTGKLSSLSTNVKTPAEMIKINFIAIKTGATQFSDTNAKLAALTDLYFQAQYTNNEFLAHSIAAYRGKQKHQEERKNRHQRKTLQERADDMDKRFPRFD